MRLARRREIRRKRRADRVQEIFETAKSLLSTVAEYRRFFSDLHKIALPSDPRRYPIMIPSSVSLKDNYEETVDCLMQIRRFALQHSWPVFLYFNRVEKLEPAAALLLAAEIHRCRNLRAYRNGAIVSGSYPRSQEISLQLKELGFFRLIEVMDDPDAEEGENRESRPFFLPFRSGNNVIAELVSAFCDIVTEGAFDMAPQAKRRMVGAIKEAMGNCVEHGYRGRSHSECMYGRWWLCGYVDPQQNEMMITILDQGVGIPETLDHQWKERFAALMNFTWPPTDGQMILAATELHRSSTGQAGRGKGFRDMRRFIDTCDDGELRVLSNRGAYLYIKGESERTSDRTSSIGGTLIEWRIRHAAAVEELGDEDDFGSA